MPQPGKVAKGTQDNISEELGGAQHVALVSGATEACSDAHGAHIHRRELQSMLHILKVIPLCVHVSQVEGQR